MSTVKFTPLPHPTSRSSSSSPGLETGGDSNTAEPNSQMSNDQTPHPSPASIIRPSGSNAKSPSTPSSPITITFNRTRSANSTSHLNPSGGRSGGGLDASDPERQPLIGTNRLNRNRVAYSAMVILAVIIGLGLVVGLGGWFLGKGEGGGRWPGGPGWF